MDAFGNEEHNTKELYATPTFDLIPPETKIDVSDPIHNNFYVKSYTRFSLLATDDASGIAFIFYRIIRENDHVSWWKQYTHSFTLSQEGTCTIEYYAVDGAGNVEWPKTKTYYVDDTPPFITLAFDGPYAYYDAPFVTSSTILILESRDTGCGIDGIYYKIDAEDWISYSGGFTISQEGTYTVQYYGVDHLNNINGYQEVLHVDDTPPDTCLEIIGIHYRQDNNEYITPETSLVISANDTGLECCGIHCIQYRIDNQAWMNYTAPFTLKMEGMHELAFCGIDNLGNHIVRTQIVIMDDSPPETSFTLPKRSYLHLFGRSIIPTLLGQTIVIGSVDVTYDGTDNSGIKKVDFYIDGELRHTDTDAPFTWTWDEFVIGYRTLEIVATDNLRQSTSEKCTVLMLNI